MDDSVLLIVGYDLIRRHLSTLITQNGYGCCPVADLRRGLDELRRGSYAFVIVDLDDLCDVHSFELATRLRAARPQACIVGLGTAPPRGATSRRFAAAGGPEAPEPDTPFDAVISKPFVLDHLLQVLAAGAATGPH